ncbi:site-specific integrase [Streptomyces mirabilis]|uniref:hypothetical protein n=1 Tax=Streptomyces mirabilis TaxID=68239 RepID=UPI0037135A19
MHTERVPDCRELVRRGGTGGTRTAAGCGVVRGRCAAGRGPGRRTVPRTARARRRTGPASGDLPEAAATKLAKDVERRLAALPSVDWAALIEAVQEAHGVAHPLPEHPLSGGAVRRSASAMALHVVAAPLAALAGLTPHTPIPAGIAALGPLVDTHPRLRRLTFATTTLLQWYRAGADVQAKLPLLTTHLGHADPKSTYWYLPGSPELLLLAAARLEHSFGGRS